MARKCEARHWVGIDLVGFILPSLSWIHSCWLEFAAIGLDPPLLGFVLLSLGCICHCWWQSCQNN